MSVSVDWSKGELIIICQAHRRRCYLQPAEVDGYGPRVRHQGRDGTEGDLCEGSQRFWVRREITASRAELLSAVLDEETGVWR